MSADSQFEPQVQNQEDKAQEIKPSEEAYQEVLDFWFQELTPKQWFEKDPRLDKDISERFGAIYEALLTGDLGWRVSSEGELAEIIVLDQMGRNIHRHSAKMFAGDAKALNLAKSLVATGKIAHFSRIQQSFILSPYMHSESIEDHDAAIVIRRKYRLDLEWEIKHQQIIERFGRYPHRNALLGRVSTKEELEFLETPGSSF
ncbi:MAG: DUF924 domain-containing protein [Cellvibrionales bacterium]|nr:DUF924 domain-containing protein [Cellvibrionales bacterium]